MDQAAFATFAHSNESDLFILIAGLFIRFQIKYRVLDYFPQQSWIPQIGPLLANSGLGLITAV